MKNSKISLIILLWVSVGTACQEDDPVLPLSELLRGRQWQLESRTIAQPDGSVEDLPLDYCDIELWEFRYDLLSIDYHFISLGGEDCAEESFSLDQSFHLLDDHVLLKGYQQGLTEYWSASGHTLTDMRITALGNEKIRVVYRLTEDATTKTASRRTVTDTLVHHATTGP